MKPNPTQEPDAAEELLSLGKRLCCLVWRLIWTFCKWMLENVLIFIACLLALAFGLDSIPSSTQSRISFICLLEDDVPKKIYYYKKRTKKWVLNDEFSGYLKTKEDSFSAAHSPASL